MSSLDRLLPPQVLSEPERDRLFWLLDRLPGTAIQAYAPDGTIVFWNACSEQLYGYRREEALGRNLGELLMQPEEARAFTAAAHAALEHDHEIEAGIFQLRTRGGTLATVHSSHAHIRMADGETLFFCMDVDLSEQSRAEAQIRELAFYDALTALPNRRLFLDRLDKTLAASRRHGQHGALLFLDLDGFKTINDTRGHSCGDALLAAVARRLDSNVRASDTVARLGGDEFVVLLDQLASSPEEASRQAGHLAEILRLAISEPFVLYGHAHTMSTSIGICLFQGETESAQTLMMQADMALYQAKAAGRNAWRFFDQAMQAEMETRAALETGLRHALAHGEFHLEYQPQFNSAGRAYGVEALLRWQRADGESIPPNRFIPVAEETGLILPVGLWVIQEACRQLALWQDDPQLRNLTVSVNISARQFRQSNFVEQIGAILAQSGVRPQRLKFELTESMLLDNLAEAARRMHALKALGIALSLDDFGTGYSSLRYLKHLPFDEVKIDRSFLAEMVDKREDAQIVRAIIAMCRSLDIAVVAEGVETQQQFMLLIASDCQHFQGWLFARSQPPARLAAALDYSLH